MSLKLDPTDGGTGLTSTGTAGNVLTSDGTNWTSSAPTVGSIAGPYADDTAAAAGGVALGGAYYNGDGYVVVRLV